MSLLRAFRPVVHAVDRAVAAAALRSGREQPALIAFAFHALFEDAREADAGMVAPFQPLTTSDLRHIVDYIATHGYRFVAPAQIAAGLDAGGRYAWLTFDDGYANNLRALDVLREYRIPATFFVSTSHVLEGKSFWWDVLYRERRRRGASAAQVLRELGALQQRSCMDIDALLCSEFGAAALRPAGDTDRPLTAAELRRFAGEALVSIGNHTADHAALPPLPDDVVRAQIRSCQAALVEITGAAADVIAYPHGLYDARIMRLARAEGLHLGTVVEPRKTRIPIAGDARMRIARYLLCDGVQRLDDALLACRSDIQIVNGVRRLRGRW